MRVKIAAALAFLFLCGCNAGFCEEASARFTLGVVLKTMDAEHWMEIRSGMEHAAGEYGARLILQYPSDELAAAEQKTILEDMLSQPLDALLFSPCDSGDTAWLAQAAAGKGLPLFTVDTGATDSQLPYIGSDNRAIGRMAYEYLLSALGEGQKIGVITGTSRQASLSGRVSGLGFYCSRDRLLEIACTDTGCNSYADAYHAARRQIASGEVSAIFCTSGVLGMGAAGAREEMGRRDVLLIAVDTQSDVLNALHEGRLDALITQSGYEIGYQAVAKACDRLSGGTVPPNYYIENVLLTPGSGDSPAQGPSAAQSMQTAISAPAK